MNRIVICLAVTLAIAAAVTLGPEPAATGAGASRTYVILGEDGRLPADLGDRIARAGGSLERTIPQIGVAVAASSRPDFSTVARRIPGVEGVGANARFRAAAGAGTAATLYGVDQGYTFAQEKAAQAYNPPNAAEDDMLFDAQWNLDAVDAPEAWDTGEKGDGVRVFVLDSGIASAHPDISPNLNLALCKSFVPGEHFDAITTQPARPLPFFNHGTHVAGIIGAADNAVGIIGVAPECEIVAVKVLSQVSGFGYTDWIADGIVYAADNGADIINMSLGGILQRRGYLETLGTPDPSDDYWVTPKEVAADLNAFERALQYAHKKGVTVIVSAGNESQNANADKDAVIAPAELAHVIAVSATAPRNWAVDQTTDLDVPAFYSNFGASLVDFSAPGGAPVLPPNLTIRTVGRVTARQIAFDFVLSASPGGWFWAAGTSMAAPHVSAVAAMIIAKNGGSMHPDQVYAALRKAVDDIGRNGRDDFHGHGRINAYKAVK
jgi:subtilisin family serine protease